MKKILIANRGEIAVRIIRAAKELGIGTVAVYSEPDREALHVQLADEAICIGPAASKDSYLNVGNLMSAATLTGCDGVHPGYGFLAENAAFAELCRACNIQFIGPSPEAIARMGIKDVAKRAMIEAGVPVVPGSDGIVASEEQALAEAKAIGFPVIIKATAGGGGKGIRVARDEKELLSGIRMTEKEAAAAFGNPGVYLEKYIERFRHVEIQVLADRAGHTIHLGERDCTIQRRMQKLLEEAPSPALSAQTRAKMGEAAVRAAQAVGYESAGTIEFIYVPDTEDFYFMEMNTRIQVEHPVTEAITGIDLVKEQIRIASGEPLDIRQEDVQFSGWAIECRINAENPLRNFMPSPGVVENYLAPGGPGIRVDSAMYSGYSIPPHYDSMVAKVIAHGTTREEAIAKMKRALHEFIIIGVDTTIPLHERLMEHPVFCSGKFDVKFLEEADVFSE